MLQEPSTAYLTDTTRRVRAQMAALLPVSDSAPDDYPGQPELWARAARAVTTFVPSSSPSLASSTPTPR